MDLDDEELEATKRLPCNPCYREDMFKRITKDMCDLYIKKNSDYGGSVTKTFEEFGLTSFLVRLSDKLNRLISINKKQSIEVKDEKITDTLMDMANYCIIAMIELEAHKND